MSAARLGVWTLAATLVAVTAHAQPAPRTWDEKPISLPLVRTGVAYVPHTQTSHVVLFISGDAGWNAGVVEMAQRIAAQQHVVIGIAYPGLIRAGAEHG